MSRMNKPLTTAEAAAHLGVTRWRVNAMIRDGRLKATRLGQIFVIDEKDLKAVEVRTPGRPPKAKAEDAPATNGATTKATAKKGEKK
jgi:excisionase family DNA binding protein